jgi:glycosyltransferase involved in cell wall biosynthesis
VRIIYLHQYFNTPAMSGGTRSYEMARRLVDWGHEVQMVTSRRSGEGRGWTETGEAGIRVHWCPVPYSNHMSFSRRIRAFLDFCRWSAAKAAQLPGDVLFATSTPLTIALPAACAARRKRIPMVFEVRDLWPETPIAVGALKSRPAIAAARWLERFAYRHSTRIVALSPGMKDGVVAAGYPAEGVTVIPNSCDLDLFRVDPHLGWQFRERFDWLGDRPLVVYTGALGIINDVGYLARLAAAIRPIDPELRIAVVGEGREEDKVRRIAEELGVLGQNFFMLPAAAKRDMPAVLSAADVATSTVLPIPALEANSANKVFDALAAGRPIAINHEGWLADLIRRTGCGLVLDGRDAEKAARDLIAAVRNPFWLAKSRAAAARVAENQFSRDKLAWDLESVLVDAVGGAEEPKRRAA